jgi:BRCT domain type II-containing protein
LPNARKLLAFSFLLIGQETDPEKIKTIRYRNIPTISEEEGKYLVRFHIEGVRSLIGNE